MYTANSTIIGRPESLVGLAPILRVATLTGGGVDALDGLSVSGLSSDYTLGVLLGDSLSFYRLRALAGGEAGDGVSIVVPSAAPTMAWVRVL